MTPCSTFFTKSNRHVSTILLVVFDMADHCLHLRNLSPQLQWQGTCFPTTSLAFLFKLPCEFLWQRLLLCIQPKVSAFLTYAWDLPTMRSGPSQQPSTSWRPPEQYLQRSQLSWLQNPCINYQIFLLNMPQAFKTQYVLNLNHFLKLALPSSLCRHLNEAFNVPKCLSQKPESHSPRPLSLPTHTNHQLPVLPSFAWVHVSPYPLSSFRPLSSLTKLLSLLTWFPYLILTWVWKEQTIMSLYCLKPLIGSLFYPTSHEAPQPFLNLVSTNLSSVSSFLCTCPSLCLEYSSLQNPTSLTTTFQLDTSFKSQHN